MSWRAGKRTAERGYGSRWQRARASYLQAHPLCVYCHQQGRVIAATVVDHITPHRGDQALFWDSGNWQALCARCHNTVKRQEERGLPVFGLDGFPAADGRGGEKVP